MWMFGTRTTVKKVRNSLTWFSHGSGATLAPEPLVRVPFSTTRVFETLFFFELKFFFPDGCMAQRSRCPGGRPSVSAN